MKKYWQGVVLAVLCAVVGIAMAGVVACSGATCWSKEARESRLLRAMEKNFIKPHSAEGKQYIQVDREVAPLVRRMARGRELHSKLEKEMGTSHHFLRHAVLAARLSLPAAGMAVTDNIRKQADKAKHWVNPGKSTSRRSWADISEEEFPAFAPLPAVGRMAECGVQCGFREVAALSTADDPSSSPFFVKFEMMIDCLLDKMNDGRALVDGKVATLVEISRTVRGKPFSAVDAAVQCDAVQFDEPMKNESVATAPLEGQHLTMELIASLMTALETKMDEQHTVLAARFEHLSVEVLPEFVTFDVHMKNCKSMLESVNGRLASEFGTLAAGEGRR
mmetsp:Transcript_53319/g.152847  ORF Transcript_53319/g.152847 Transcript_53319/m.152847 type:complete len:334 (-) Transcript_53319:450-1451(-)